MADGLNRVMLMGNLGADSELRFTQGGQAVLNMRLATTESYLDKNKERQERTDWHNVTLWGKRGEALAKFLTKGSTLFVEGSLRTSSYEAKDGQKRYKTEVIATNVILAGGKRGGGDGDEERPSGGGGGYGSRAGGYGSRQGGAAAPRDAAGPTAERRDEDGAGGGTFDGDDIPF